MAIVHLAYDDALHTPDIGDVFIVVDDGLVEPVAGSEIGGSSTLDGLDDVVITSPADNEVLAYDSGSGDFINQTAAEAGLATASHLHDDRYYTETETDNLLDDKIDTSQIGSANGVASLDSSGKIPTGQLPALAITDVHVVADITARNALTVQEGDVAIVNDAGDGDPASYIYDGSAWQELEATDHTHNEYLTEAQADALYDALGTASSAISTHEGAGDPHPQYLTQAEGDGLYVSQTGHTEAIQDIVGGMVTGNTETLITVTYEDGDGTIDFVIDNDLANYNNSNTNFRSLAQVQSEIDTRVDKSFVDALNVDADTLDGIDSTGFATSSHNHSGTYAPVSHDHPSTDITDWNEAVSDAVGGMVTGNTETLITVTYDDADNTLDFVVNNDLSQYSNATSGFQTAAQVSSIITSDVDKAFVDALNVDADTVDGQHASAFATSGHNHDGDYVDVTGDTMTGALTMQSTLIMDNSTFGWINGGQNVTIDFTPGTGTLDFAYYNGAVTVQPKLRGVGTPTNTYDAANKTYVDTNFASTSHTHIASNITDFAEAVSDQVGTMVTGNTETGIAITYDDTDNTIDAVLDFQPVESLPSPIPGGSQDVTGISQSADASTHYGTTSKPARSDHRHGIVLTIFDTTNPAQLTPDIAAATGSQPRAARRDHVHNVPAGAPTTTLTATTTNAEGNGTSFARNNHTHAISTGTAVGIDNSSVNATGTATSLARSDHTHAVSGFATTGHTHSAYVAKTGDTMTGDLEFGDIGEGVILRSPNGDRWRITIDNTGNVISTGPL